MAIHLQHLILLALLLILQSIHTVSGLWRPFQRNRVAVEAPPPPQTLMEMPEVEIPPLLGEDDDEEQTDHVAETVASLQIIYGTTLLLYGTEFPEQILVLTMMRATGFATIEIAIRTARKNLRRAIRFAVWRAPSFLKLRKSILDIHDRIDDARRELAATKQAKADGVITAQEERQLKRMHKRDMRLLRRDRMRFQRGMINVGKVLQLLDIEAILEILKSFLYQFITVLAAGHSQSKVCIMITSWCYFWSLGSLLVDATQKLMNSIRRRTFFDRIQKRRRMTIGFLGKTGIIILAFYLMEVHGDVARRLNAALLEAAIILRGLRYFVDAVWDRDEDSVLATLAKRLERTGGGLLIVALAVVSLYCASNLDSLWTPPHFLLAPMQAIENGIWTLSEIFAL